jgi:hypothetical protein
MKTFIVTSAGFPPQSLRTLSPPLEGLHAVDRSIEGGMFEEGIVSQGRPRANLKRPRRYELTNCDK